MTRRELLIAKMCEVYAEAVEWNTTEYAMEKALTLAERFAQTAVIENEEITYAHRAMGSPPAASIERALPLIHTWLRYDTSLELRKKISAEDCEKLAIRIAPLL
jgi:hypothetical protein